MLPNNRNDQLTSAGTRRGGHQVDGCGDSRYVGSNSSSSSVLADRRALPSLSDVERAIALASLDRRLLEEEWLAVQRQASICRDLQLLSYPYDYLGATSGLIPAAQAGIGVDTPLEAAARQLQLLSLPTQSTAASFVLPRLPAVRPGLSPQVVPHHHDRLARPLWPAANTLVPQEAAGTSAPTAAAVTKPPTNTPHGEGARNSQQHGAILLHNMAFPERLHRMVTDAEANDQSHIISFSPSGTAFTVHDRSAFLREIASQYSQMTKFTSLKRQLYLYGFEIVRGGPEDGSYAHPFFRKGRPELARQMQRIKKRKEAGGANEEAG